MHSSVTMCGNGTVSAVGFGCFGQCRTAGHFVQVCKLQGIWSHPYATSTSNGSRSSIHRMGVGLRSATEGRAPLDLLPAASSEC
jgi:hypothetical protein